jgi:hypothetical protein
MISFLKNKKTSTQKKRDFLIEVLENLPVDDLQKSLYRQSLFLLSESELEAFYITIQNEFQWVQTTHSEERRKQTYYHPYPSFVDNLNTP